MKTLLFLTALLPLSAFAQVDLNFAGCTESAFVEWDGVSEIRTQGSNYTPKCLKIKRGSEIIIQASSHHPLQGVDSGLNNPIFNPAGSHTTTMSYLFEEAGVFGYFCVNHGSNLGQGMAAAIWVTE